VRSCGCIVQVISGQVGMEQLHGKIGRLRAEARDLLARREPPLRKPAVGEADTERVLHRLRQEVEMLEDSMVVTPKRYALRSEAP
jgi:hypothetical protein